MRKKTIERFTKEHYIENDSTLKNLNKVLKVLFRSTKARGTHKFYFSFCEDATQWDGRDVNQINAPVIKVSEFFKPKKVKKPNLEYRVSKLEKALEIENSLFKAVAEDFDKTVSKDQEKRDEIVKEVAKIVQDTRNIGVDSSGNLIGEMGSGYKNSGEKYKIVKYKGIDKPVVEEL